jgi:pectin methylesterase-like acyl-CoA thioesterase
VADSWPTQLPLFHAVWKGWSDAQTGKRARLQRAEEMTSDVERARLHDLAAGCARQAGRRPGPELAQAQRAAVAANAAKDETFAAIVAAADSVRRVRSRTRRRFATSMSNLVGGRLAGL